MPADVDEAYQATLATPDIDGPVYLRLGGRSEEPPVTDAQSAFRLGKAAQLRAGNDVAILACGALVEPAVRASDALKKEGVAARVLNMSSIKPFDRDAVLKAAAAAIGQRNDMGKDLIAAPLNSHSLAAASRRGLNNVVATGRIPPIVELPLAECKHDGPAEDYLEH